MARFGPHVRVTRIFQRRPIIFAVFLLVVIYIACILTVMISERVDFFDAMLLLIPSFLGELGSIEATPADIATILSLGIYVLFMAIVVGKLSEALISRALKGGLAMRKVNHKDHVVVCGWNYQGPQILESLLSLEVHKKKAIVVLADTEENPYDSTKVDFVRGCPWKRDDLIRAGIEHADTAIILTNIRGGGEDNPDADALMITLSIETLNSKVHTIVQLLSSENRVHLENANADEIICLDQVGGKLAVSSALNHGLSTIINELLTFDKGSEFYRYHREMPDQYVGRTFWEVAKQLIDRKMILIAVETEKDICVTRDCSNDWVHSVGHNRAMVINPQSDYRFRKGDSLFVISEQEPTEL